MIIKKIKVRVVKKDERGLYVYTNTNTEITIRWENHTSEREETSHRFKK